MSADIIAPIKRHHERPVIRCGACKGTGVEHAWKLPDAILVPTGRPCPTCGGSGASQDVPPSHGGTKDAG